MLTNEDLQAISDLFDKKFDEKFDEKIKPIQHELSSLKNEKHDILLTMSSLGISGLQVMEQNNMYKITGKVFETKDEAREALKSAGAEGAFVTTVYE